jgi:hypothetical protein
MQMVRARVRNGRLVVDEPTDLPEGSEVDLAVLDDEAWDLSPGKHAELKARLASSDPAKAIPAADVLARLRAG